MERSDHLYKNYENKRHLAEIYTSCEGVNTNTSARQFIKRFHFNNFGRLSISFQSQIICSTLLSIDVVQ